MTYERELGGELPLAATAGEHLVVDHAHPTDIPVGCPVYTADEQRLGTVKELQAGCFKVDAPLQPDYWLSTRDVAAVTLERLVLSFAKEQLAEFKVEPSASA